MGGPSTTYMPCPKPYTLSGDNKFCHNMLVMQGHSYARAYACGLHKPHSRTVSHCSTFRRSNAGTAPALRSCILGIGGKALAASLTAATVLEVPLSIVGNLHVASGITLGFESDTLGFESVLMQQAMHRLVVERHQCCLTATALCADIIEKFDPHVVSDYKRKNIAAAQG